MAVAVKLSLADRAFLRKTHRANAAIFMDQRLFLGRVYRAVFFPHGWTPFFLWMLHELSFSAQKHYKSRLFSSSFNIFFSATSVSSCVFFHEHGRLFLTQNAFRVVFFRLDQRPFFRREHIESSSFPRGPSFFDGSTNFSIWCYKPVALLSVILQQFKISRF